MTSFSFQKPKNLKKAISATLALAENPTFKEPCLINDWVAWLEQRPEERGRTTLLIRPWFRKDLTPQELTLSPINLRSRVHDYGGGVFTTATEGDQLHVAWIDDSDGCLWYQSWEGLNQIIATEENWLKPIKKAKRLSRIGASALADGLIDFNRKRWIGVMESGNKDFLVEFALNEIEQEPRILHEALDFAGYTAISPSGDQISWVEWQQPWMPWDSSQLWLAKIDKKGTFQNKVLIAGRQDQETTQISVFQPIWSTAEELLIAEDSSGWWNLMVSIPTNSTKPLKWNSLWPMEAETAMPQWVYGMSTTAWAGEEVLASICKNGRWSLKMLDKEGTVQNIDQPFDDLSGLKATQGRAVLIASNPVKGNGLLEIDLAQKSWSHSPSSPPLLKEDEISTAEAIWFEGYQGHLTHAWYYPPTRDCEGTPPLLVKSHSGPTSMTNPGFNKIIQFWTSRGWAVVDVNYGGSTGFGRRYRERLKQGWGIVDVHDCANAAKTLIQCGKANSSQVAIEGGSAGGFTTLSCLCFTDIFKVGACRYAVSDLTSMIKSTHRFEARYLDSLIGEFPQQERLYIERSPLMNANKINCPVIFFQGLKDKVVPFQQTQRMVSALKNNNIPVELHTFSEEGHGFRDSKVQIKVLEKTEQFFRKHLNL